MDVLVVLDGDGEEDPDDDPDDGFAAGVELGVDEDGGPSELEPLAVEPLAARLSVR